MTITKEQIDKLDGLQAQQNNGRGVSCVRTIVSCLRKDQYNDGLACCLNESDKIRNYPEIYVFLEEIFPEFKQFNDRLRTLFG